MSEITYLPGKEPHPRETRRIFRNVNRVGYDPSIKCFMKDGGYETLKKVLKMEPADVINEVKKSGLRGRGGAGFPTGVKWTFIPRGNTKPVYLVCNCDESEPGTFKDRFIVHQDPHQLIEGLVIACYAVQAHFAVIYMREEFPEAAKIVQKAIKEAEKKGFLGDDIQGSGFNLKLILHRGAGAYICGEETGLINSIEGVRPYPRIKPPFFPAAIGLYGCPTIVNNVESLCQVRQVMMRGAEAYSAEGAQRSPGTRIIGVSGDVKRPGVYEIISGSITYGELLYDICGGPKRGRKFKAIIPGGASAKVMRCDEILKDRNPDGTVKEMTIFDVPMDLDSIAKFGSMSGSGGVIVMDDSRSMPHVLNNLNRFFAWESCGQCSPCREGNPWMLKLSTRICEGKGSPADVDLLKDVADNICGRTVCAFGEACSWPTQAFTTKFRDEFLALTKPINAQKPHSSETAEARKFLTRED